MNIHNYKKLPLLSIFVLLAACGNSGPEESRVSVTPGTGPADRGAQLFAAKCTACHGPDGTAGIGKAANLKTSSLDSASVVFIMINGKGAMPPFKDQLSGEDLQKLAAYVRTLRQ